MSVKEGRLRKARTQEVNAGKMFKLCKLEWSRWPGLSHTSCYNLTIFTQENKTTLSKCYISWMEKKELYGNYVPLKIQDE
jgi:hypothetical protein